jgi:uncharacterized membrane protein (DUF2068 family)
VIYAATTVFFAVLFVRALGRHEIRSGAFSYGLFTTIAAVGLWKQRNWGRIIALVIALGTSALGALATFSSLLAHEGSLTGPLVLFVVSTALTYLLSRPIFYPPEI